MWDRHYRNVERHFLRFYGRYGFMIMIVSLTACFVTESPKLDFLDRFDFNYDKLKSGANFAFILSILSAPALYLAVGLMLVWADKLSPGRAFRNLVVGALVTIISHAIVYNKGNFLLPDPNNTVEATLKFYNCLYFSIVTFTTLGYGDFTPDPPYRLIAALQGIYGYIFLGTLVGMTTTFVSSPSARFKKDEGPERPDRR